MSSTAGLCRRCMFPILCLASGSFTAWMCRFVSAQDSKGPQTILGIRSFEYFPSCQHFSSQILANSIFLNINLSPQFSEPSGSCWDLLPGAEGQELASGRKPRQCLSSTHLFILFVGSQFYSSYQPTCENNCFIYFAQLFVDYGKLSLDFTNLLNQELGTDINFSFNREYNFKLRKKKTTIILK